MIPTINKPTRVTRNTATVIGNLITNTIQGKIQDTQSKSEIIQTDSSRSFSYYIYPPNKRECG